LDVHQKSVTACRIPPEATGQQAEGLRELKACGTLTVDLRALSAWRTEVGIPPGALASTGESWQPVLTLLEGSGQVVLVHAAQVKQGPGRQTDNAEARWRAQLRRDGVLQASFIPSPGQRDRRALPRDRTTWGQERSREVNGVQGGLERATIKRAAVASEIMGVSGRALRAVLSAGRTEPATMAELATGRLRRKLPLLEQALTGLVRDPQRRMLALQLAPSEFLAEQLEARSAAITRCLTALRADAPPPR